MSNNVNGGKKAARTMLARDPDHYKKMGAIGGKNGHTGGFTGRPDLARIAGKKGAQKRIEALQRRKA